MLNPIINKLHIQYLKNVYQLLKVQWSLFSLTKKKIPWLSLTCYDILTFSLTFHGFPDFFQKNPAICPGFPGCLQPCYNNYWFYFWFKTKCQFTMKIYFRKWQWLMTKFDRWLMFPLVHSIKNFYILSWRSLTQQVALAIFLFFPLPLNSFPL